MLDLSNVALMITLAGLEAQRRLKGAAWCETQGVGAIRAVLGPEQPVNVVELAPELREYNHYRREAVQVLMTFCRVCGECQLGRVSGPPSAEPRAPSDSLLPPNVA